MTIIFVVLPVANLPVSNLPVANLLLVNLMVDLVANLSIHIICIDKMRI